MVSCSRTIPVKACAPRSRRPLSKLESDHRYGRYGTVCASKRVENSRDMPIMFNTLLKDVGLDLADVRLLRHKDQRAAKGRSLYELWRDAHQQFDLYQTTQKI